MNQPVDNIKAAAGVIRSLKAMQELTLSVSLATGRRNLIFRFLNDTIKMLSYSRAAMWDITNIKPRLLGVSGQANIERNSPLAVAWRDFLQSLNESGRGRVLSREDFPGAEKKWDELCEKTGGLSVLWLPLATDGGNRVALWFERWGEAKWDEAELDQFMQLAKGYSAVWERMSRPSLARKVFGRPLALLVAAIVLYVLFFVKVPLRVVAPCEVVAADPVAVTAPLNGIVEHIYVKPASEIKKGDVLFSYDRRLADNELEILRHNVEAYRSELKSTEALALHDGQARARVAIVRERLRQAEARLSLAVSEAVKLDVCSPADGIAEVGSPESWEGRAVRIGERVMLIVDPARTKLRIWLPEGDRIDFDWSQDIVVFLKTGEREPTGAVFDSINNTVSLNPNGIASFIIEAKWSKAEFRTTPGLKGSAVIYGKERVTVAYWLLRKPIAAVRGYFGI